MRGGISSSSLSSSFAGSCAAIFNRASARLHRHPYPFRSSRLLGNSLHPTESYLIGPTEPPLFEHNFPVHWSNHVLPIYHDHLALVSKFEPASPVYQANRRDCLRLTYSQLDQSINSIALSLHQLGIRKGDRVGINTPNHSIYPILQLATSKIGAILATINPSYAPSELLNAIKKVGCKVLFSTPSFKSKDMIPTLSDLLCQSPFLTNLIIVDNESYRTGKRSKDEIFKKIQSNSCTSVRDLNDFLYHQPHATSPIEKIKDDLQANEVVNLQFTSGTTGIPKAVSLTHRNLLNNAIHIADRIKLTSSDLVCNVPPMFHCFGSVIGNLATIVKGATIVIPSQTFDPNAVLRTVSEENCTVLNGVGTMFLAEINELDQMKDVIDLSSLRTGVVAGSPVPEELMNRIENRLGIKELTILYGMTETSPGTFQTRASDDAMKRKTTVGSIYPHTMAKVVDLQSRKVVNREQKGELLVSGYSLQKGYWNDQAETDKAMVKDEEGRIWMKSGDIALIDSEGYLKIVGRAKEVIIRGGENLYPVVIENCISKLKGVGDAAVVGVEDQFYGEVVGVFIKRKGNATEQQMTPQNLVTEQDVRAAVKDKMSGANVPKYVWFFDSIGRKEFPMTASGKIKKNELKLWVQDLMKVNG